MNKLLILISILSISFYSCSKKETDRLSAYHPFSGRWVQQLPDTIAFFTGSFRTYTFDKDSFSGYILYWNDATNQFDPCSGVINNYIKGTFSVSGDSINFSGIMYDSLYRTPHADCNGTSIYKEQFMFRILDDTTMVLNPDQAVFYGDIVLKKRG